jgi:hypothetical protein
MYAEGLQNLLATLRSPHEHVVLHSLFVERHVVLSAINRFPSTAESNSAPIESRVLLTRTRCV